MEKQRFLNPGSDEALDAGCLCAVLDNNHGRGYFGIPNQFVISEDCPLHGQPYKGEGGEWKEATREERAK